MNEDVGQGKMTYHVKDFHDGEGTKGIEAFSLSFVDGASQKR